MRNVTVTINIEETRMVERTYERGTYFEKNGNKYVLYIDPNKGQHIAALVNMATGEGIHKPKSVANANFVTEAELATLNFKNSSPATLVG